jgi:hypothetical protein
MNSTKPIAQYKGKGREATSDWVELCVFISGETWERHILANSGGVAQPVFRYRPARCPRSKKTANTV